VSLLGEVFELPHEWRDGWDERREDMAKRFELDEPDQLVVRTRHFGPGHFEASVRWMNLQPLADRADILRPGRKGCAAPEDREENMLRAARRARQAVRVKCIQIRADRMLTFGTRGVLPLSVLLAHWHAFVRAYRAVSHGVFRYCAVPETHADGVHYHLHVAVSGWFSLAKALRIWHAITAEDVPGGGVNGSINVKMFYSRRHRENPVAAIASYIAKYAGKRLDGELEKKRYWASRTAAVEVCHKILRARDWASAQREIGERYGVNWVPLLLSDTGNFFVFPDGRGFWFRVVPMDCHSGPPF